MRRVLGGQPAPAKGEELEPGGGEGLARAVVEVPGDALSLLFLKRHPPLGEEGGDAFLRPGDGADRKEEQGCGE